LLTMAAEVGACLIDGGLADQLRAIGTALEPDLRLLSASALCTTVKEGWEIDGGN
jgi:hypothetical protein